MVLHGACSSTDYCNFLRIPFSLFLELTSPSRSFSRWLSPSRTADVAIACRLRFDITMLCTSHPPFDDTSNAFDLTSIQLHTMFLASYLQASFHIGDSRHICASPSAKLFSSHSCFPYVLRSSNVFYLPLGLCFFFSQDVVTFRETSCRATRRG